MLTAVHKTSTNKPHQKYTRACLRFSFLFPPPFLFCHVTASTITHVPLIICNTRSHTSTQRERERQTHTHTHNPVAHFLPLANTVCTPCGHLHASRTPIHCFNPSTHIVHTLHNKNLPKHSQTKPEEADNRRRDETGPETDSWLSYGWLKTAACVRRGFWPHSLSFPYFLLPFSCYTLIVAPE